MKVFLLMLMALVSGAMAGERKVPAKFEFENEDGKVKGYVLINEECEIQELGFRKYKLHLYPLKLEAQTHGSPYYYEATMCIDQYDYEYEEYRYGCIHVFVNSKTKLTNCKEFEE